VDATYFWFSLRDYSGLADPAHFARVTDAWRAVVAPNQVVCIGLLILFQATAGVLILSGGRRTQLGLVATIGFRQAADPPAPRRTDARPRSAQ